MDVDIEMDEIKNLGDGDDKNQDKISATKSLKKGFLKKSTIPSTLRSFELRIDFDVLWEEWQPTTSEFAETSSLTYLTDLALFASSTYDVVADGLVAKSFIAGTNYTKVRNYHSLTSQPFFLALLFKTSNNKISALVA